MLRAFGDGRLFGDVDGTLPVAAIGLHGWRRDRHDLARALRGLNTARFDLPGFGVSPPPPEPWGARDYAALLNEVLPELADRPVVVVAHSFGGRVGVCAAAARPDLFAGLVLTGVPLLRSATSRRPPLRLRIARWGNSFRLVSDARVARLRDRFGSEDYRVATGVMRDVLVRIVNESYEQELEALRCPVRLIWGSADTAVPVRVAEEALSHLRDGSLDLVDGVGHDLPLHVPTQLREACEKLLVAVPGVQSEIY